MTRAVVNISIAGRYEKLAERQREAMAATSPETTLLQWVDRLPAGANSSYPLPYRAYCAKPFAMLEAAAQGFTSLIWMDSACMPVRSLEPLWEHIEREGYYAQDNGWIFGEWASDLAIKNLGIGREESFSFPDISTCVLGLDLRRQDCRTFLDEWARLAEDGQTFWGEHTNDIGPAATKGVNYRNVGHISDDPRVMGTRHDQTAASALAWRRGWKLTPRPVFVDYWKAGKELDPRTVIVNKGAL